MKLTTNEEQVLILLDKEERRGMAGYINLSKKLSPQIKMEDIRKTILSLEEKCLARYMRTQDRNLILGQITNEGAHEVHKNLKNNTLLERFNRIMKSMQRRNIVAIFAIALVIVAGGHYMSGTDFQANFFAIEHSSPEEAIMNYENLAQENVQINFAGQLGENYFYQVDTNTAHYLFTLQKNNGVWSIEDVENLHR